MLVKLAFVYPQIILEASLDEKDFLAPGIGESADAGRQGRRACPGTIMSPAGSVDKAQRGSWNQQVIHGFQRRDVVNVLFWQVEKVLRSHFAFLIG